MRYLGCDEGKMKEDLSTDQRMVRDGRERGS